MRTRSGTVSRKRNGSPTPPTDRAAFAGVVCSSGAALAAGIRYFRMQRTSLWDNKPATGGTLAHDHFGLQAQDAGAALVCIFNRQHSHAETRGALSARYLHASEDVSRAWGQRGTLHMYATSDWPVAMAATRARLYAAATSSATRCGSGALANEAVTVVADELRKGLETDSRIVEKMSGDASAIVRSSVKRNAFIAACAEGLGTRVTRKGNLARLVVLAPAAAGAWRDVTVDDAMREAAERYFSCYAPARERDFRYWMGVHAGESKRAVNGLIDDGVLVHVEGMEEMLVAKTCVEKLMECLKKAPPREEWPVKLLGRFDPYLLPHIDKNWVVGDRWRSTVWTRNADILPTVLIHGRVRGVWKCTRKSGRVDVSVRLFGDEGVISEREMEMVESEARRFAVGFWEATECDVDIVMDGGGTEEKVEREVKGSDAGVETVGKTERRKRQRRTRT